MPNPPGTTGSPPKTPPTFGELLETLKPNKKHRRSPSPGKYTKPSKRFRSNDDPSPTTRKPNRRIRSDLSADSHGLDPEVELLKIKIIEAENEQLRLRLQLEDLRSRARAMERKTLFTNLCRLMAVMGSRQEILFLESRRQVADLQERLLRLNQEEELERQQSWRGNTVGRGVMVGGKRDKGGDDSLDSIGKQYRNEAEERGKKKKDDGQAGGDDSRLDPTAHAKQPAITPETECPGNRDQEDPSDKIDHGVIKDTLPGDGGLKPVLQWPHDVPALELPPDKNNAQSKGRYMPGGKYNWVERNR
ncbi:hypothetical protein QBC40DRAFT_249580 [Triangularia verruculosa]|uniref:Uncharacterized protein n=1 Tax=Triangularia verruculosa TaxID=2587418 RepID=A0AAN7AXC0_9PEZI|nr:hypothetical protein QBC40DRAFT_249580 [Triangularia verruculosa]